MLFSTTGLLLLCFFFFFSSRRRHTRFDCDWSSDVCSSDLIERWIRRVMAIAAAGAREEPFIAAVTAGRLDTLALFEAAVSQDVDRLDEIGRASCRERV